MAIQHTRLELLRQLLNQNTTRRYRRSNFLKRRERRLLVRPLLPGHHPRHRLRGEPSLRLLLRALIQLRKPRVREGLLRRTAHLGPQLQHLPQQLQTQVIDLRQNSAELLGSVDRPRRLELGKTRDPRPRPLGRRAHQPEDLEQLVLVRGAGEQGAAREHLRHDAAGAPDVDAGVVSPTPEQDVRGAIPQRDDLVAESVDGDAEGAREAEIREFQLPLVVDEQVLGLEVAVQDAVFVAEGYAAQELPHEAFDGAGFEGAARAAVGRVVAVHVLFEVFVHVLEDEHEFVFGVDDVVEGDDVFMFEFFHQADLAYCRAGGAFFAVEVDLFQGYEGAGLAIAAFEYLFA